MQNLAVLVRNHLRSLAGLGCAASIFMATHAMAAYQPPAQSTSGATNPPAAAKTPSEQAADEKKAAEAVEIARKNAFKQLFEDYLDNPDLPQYKRVRGAMDLFLERKIEEARREFASCKALFKTLPPAEVSMARMWLVAKVPQNARVEVEQAVKNSPTDPEAYLMIADAANVERRFTEAALVLEKAEKVLAAYNEDVSRKTLLQKRLYNLRAFMYEAQQNWAEAKPNLEEWIKLEGTKKTSLPYARLGKVLFMLSDYKNAKYGDESVRPIYAALNTAAETDKAQPSTQPSALTALGVFYYQQGRTDLAQQYFDAALGEKTGSEDRRFQTHLIAANWAISSNKLDYAKKVIAAIDAQKLKADSAEANLQVSLLKVAIARFSRDFSTAEKILDALIAKNPNDYSVVNNLALVLIEQPEGAKKQRAMTLAETTFQGAQKSQNQQLILDAAATLGWVYFKNGRFSDAGQILQAVINQTGGFTGDSAYYAAKVMLENNGRLEDAEKILTATLEKPNVFYYRGQAEELLKEIRTKMIERANGVKPVPGTGATSPTGTPGSGAPTTGTPGATPPPASPRTVPPTGTGPGQR